MPAFSYRALDGSGRVVTGEIEAADRRAVLQRLQRQGLQPVSVQARAEKSAGRTARPSSRQAPPASSQPAQPHTPGKLSSRQAASIRLLFLQRLVELLGSGLPLGDAVRLLHQRLRDPHLAGLAGDLWRLLSEGRSLANAIATRRDVFPESAVHLVEAGESSATLVPILQRLVQYEEAMATLRRKVVSSLAYPILLCVVAVGVIIFFLYFILPRIQAVLNSLGGEIGLMPRILIGGSELLLRFGPFALLALIAAGFGIKAAYQTPAGRLRIDGMLLRLPVLGIMILQTEVLRFGSLLGTLLESGINASEALRLAERTIANTELRRRFNLARIQIQEGAAIGTAFRNNEVLPELAADILSVGENTGSITGTLREIGAIYQRELESRLSFAINILTSIGMVSAFAMVAMVAFSILTSIIGVSQTLGGR